jgi:hypothetical protein
LYIDFVFEIIGTKKASFAGSKKPDGRNHTRQGQNERTEISSILSRISWNTIALLAFPV